VDVDGELLRELVGTIRLATTSGSRREVYDVSPHSGQMSQDIRARDVPGLIDDALRHR
jgi:hypothetical protein